MKRALGFFAAGILLAVSAPAIGAQTAPKSTITGAMPFTLGMASAAALAADPTLAAVSSTLCGTPAHGTSYGTLVTAPIGGYPYVAKLVLCFADDKLGAIYVTWPQGTFQGDTVRWQLATRALAQQLAGAYASAQVRLNALDEDMGGVLEIADAQGSVLRMTSDPGNDPSIRVGYMSAAYDQAVNGKRILLGSY